MSERIRDQINWKLAAADAPVVSAIVTRAMEMLKRHNVRGYSRLTARMDLVACHCNGCPLDLKALLAADDVNFSHDFFGVARHIDRNTGKLKDWFVPRFAAKHH